LRDASGGEIRTAVVGLGKEGDVDPPFRLVHLTAPQSRQCGIGGEANRRADGARAGDGQAGRDQKRNGKRDCKANGVHGGGPF